VLKKTPEKCAMWEKHITDMEAKQQENHKNRFEPQLEDVLPLPSLTILEHPDPSYRFRYGSEGAVVAPLYGAHSTHLRRTFPKIKLSNFERERFLKVDLIVSCVAHGEENPRVHPYLVKNTKRKKGVSCKNGVCHVTEVADDGTVEFRDIGIQRVKAEQTKDILAERESMGIDPFSQGFSDAQYDKEAVRLCFQVFLTDHHGHVSVLSPVVSNTISHAKGKVMSIHSVTPDKVMVDRLERLTILADNLPRAGDLWVMFFTPEWSMKVMPEYQHHNCAVQLTSPKLYVDITRVTRVQIKLVRKSNQIETESIPFYYLPSTEEHETEICPIILQERCDKDVEITEEDAALDSDNNDDKITNSDKHIMINCKYT